MTGVWAGNSDGHPMKNTTGLTGAAPIWHDFMEATLADPALLARLGAPKAAAGWEFAARPMSSAATNARRGWRAGEGGEFFSKAWLAAAGKDGPLADSVALVPTAPVYVKRGDQASGPPIARRSRRERGSSCGCPMASWDWRRQG